MRRTVDIATTATATATVIINSATKVWRCFMVLVFLTTTTSTLRNGGGGGSGRGKVYGFVYQQQQQQQRQRQRQCPKGLILQRRILSSCRSSTTTTAIKLYSTSTKTTTTNNNNNNQQNNNYYSTSFDSNDRNPSILVDKKLPSIFQSWFDLELPEGRCVGISMTINNNDNVDENDKNNKKEEDDDDDDTLSNLINLNSLIITPETVNNNNENDCGNNNNQQQQESPYYWIYSIYHPDEIEYAKQKFKKSSSSSSFWMGRLAMRIALNFPDYPILKDSYGRPKLNSPGMYGSISHKGNKGVALVSNINNKNNDNNNNNHHHETLGGVGIDLEYTERPGKRSIARRVLTDNEIQNLGNIPGISKEQEVLLRFSLKEAIYKAAHPILCQYVGFKEAEVTPHADGTATCDWYLQSSSSEKKPEERLGQLTAHWTIIKSNENENEEGESFFLTSASVKERKKRNKEIN